MLYTVVEVTECDSYRTEIYIKQTRQVRLKYQGKVTINKSNWLALLPHLVFVFFFFLQIEFKVFFPKALVEKH